MPRPSVHSGPQYPRKPYKVTTSSWTVYCNPHSCSVPDGGGCTRAQDLCGTPRATSCLCCMIIDWPPPDSAHGRAKCPPNPQQNTTRKRPSCAHPTASKNEDAELPTHPFRAPEVSSGLRSEAAVTEKLSVTLCHPAPALQVQTPQEIARNTGALRLLHAAQAKASGRQEGLPQPLCGQHPMQETRKPKRETRLVWRL